MFKDKLVSEIALVLADYIPLRLWDTDLLNKYTDFLNALEARGEVLGASLVSPTQI